MIENNNPIYTDMNQAWKTLLNTERLRISKRQKTGDPRTEFDSDYGRVIFSPAIRRMHDKTQVFPLTTDDNIHSRLTHSMEVMAIGYSLGLKLLEKTEFIDRTGSTKDELARLIPILLQSVCLVHDIGNPPFGHFGETVIQQYFDKKFKDPNSMFDLTPVQKEDFTFFDGNAQGFRILTKLQSLNDFYGLNLTYAFLASYLKYPNCDDKTSELPRKKRGVFQSEREFMNTVMKGCDLLKDDGSYKRHPLAYLMEAADSICYLVMDIEDGYNKHWYDYQYLKDYLITMSGTTEIFDWLEKEYTGYGEEIARIVNLRIALIGKLTDLAINNFVKNYDSIINGDYNKELIFDDLDGLAKKLQEFCRKEIFAQKEIQSLELTGHSVIVGLLDYYINFLFSNNKDYQKRAEGLISFSVKRSAFLENGFDELKGISDLNDYYKLRVIVDFITGMTDQFALNHYQKLSGQKLI